MLPQPRALTRDEIKALRAAGLDPAFTENDVTMKLNTDMVDWILDNIYKDFSFANLPYSDCLKLATKSYQMTYSVASEEKNS